jgi:hypothetical protein
MLPASIGFGGFTENPLRFFGQKCLGKVLRVLVS